MSADPPMDDDIRLFIEELRLSGNGTPTVDALFSMLYEPIRREAYRQLAREHQPHTLQATELVNEAYLRMRPIRGVEWENRGHVLRFVARIIRNVLVDWARRRRSIKHGGDNPKVTLITLQGKTVTPIEDILALDEALRELAAGPGNMSREAKVVELQFFIGATIPEIAETLLVSERQAFRDYRHARTWLRRKLTA